MASILLHSQVIKSSHELPPHPPACTPPHPQAVGCLLTQDFLFTFNTYLIPDHKCMVSSELHTEVCGYDSTCLQGTGLTYATYLPSIFYNISLCLIPTTGMNAMHLLGVLGH